MARDRFLRASCDRVDSDSAPSLTRGLPNDSACEVDAGVGRDDVRAGLEVGAQPNPIQRALGQRVLLSLLLVRLQRVEEYTLAELAHGVAARISFDVLIARASACPDLEPADLGGPVLGHPRDDRVVEANLHVAGARLQRELQRPQHASDFLNRSLGSAVARAVTNSRVLEDGADRSSLTSLSSNLLLEFLDGGLLIGLDNQHAVVHAAHRHIGPDHSRQPLGHRNSLPLHGVNPDGLVHEVLHHEHCDADITGRPLHRGVDAMLRDAHVVHANARDVVYLRQPGVVRVLRPAHHAESTPRSQGEVGNLMQRPLKRGRLLRAARDPWSHRLVLEVHLDVRVLAVAACRSAVACISALIFVSIPVMRVVNR